MDNETVLFVAKHIAYSKETDIPSSTMNSVIHALSALSEHHGPAFNASHPTRVTCLGKHSVASAVAWPCETRKNLDVLLYDTVAAIKKL